MHLSKFTQDAHIHRKTRLLMAPDSRTGGTIKISSHEIVTTKGKKREKMKGKCNEKIPEHGVGTRHLVAGVAGFIKNEIMRPAAIERTT